jgi:2-polyprenyl-3-methyl-5-hydroxy-6-metoxy-1,4-benzoquinol methylase
MSLIEKLLGKFNAEDLPSHPFMMEMMSRYQTKDLVNTDPKSFKEKIDSFLALSDYKMEGFSDAEKQRDLTVKFSWGHNHDFGDFFLKGRLTDRHVRLLATFMDKLNALPKSLEGKRVLDIGCWTGGTSLILCAMGAEVVAIEEVKNTPRV